MVVQINLSFKVLAYVSNWYFKTKLPVTTILFNCHINIIGIYTRQLEKISWKFASTFQVKLIWFKSWLSITTIRTSKIKLIKNPRRDTFHAMKIIENQKAMLCISTNDIYPILLLSRTQMPKDIKLANESRIFGKAKDK